ncbi:MAG: iron transporter permease, partial [Firmicutes bacterium]|nr:iron transporter permease [Bacillota bacterium]
VAVLSTALGTVLAWITARTDTPGKPVLENLFIVPTFLSPLIGATGWLMLGARNSGLINVYFRKWLGTTSYLINISSFGGMVWVMILFFTPVAYLYIVAALRSVDATIEEAARISGARFRQVLFGITLPAVTPAVLTGAIMVWVLAAEMFSVPGLLVGPTGIQPLAYKIYLAGRTYPPNHPLAAAAGIVLVLIAVLMLFAYRQITKIEGRYVTMGNKGAKPRVTRLGSWRWATFAFAWLYLTVAVILPYIAMTIGSFQGYLGAPLTAKSFTLSRWKYVLGADVAAALKNSIIVGILSGAVVVAMGAILAYILVRRKVKRSGVLDYVLSASIGIPGIAFGIGMIWAYVRTPMYGTVLILFLAFVTRYLPNGLRAASTGLLQISKDLEEGAALAGASAGRVLWDITVPMLKPVLFAAWALTTITVLRELSVSAILYTPQSRVISVLAWDYLETGQYGYACAVGLIQTALVIAILALARILFKIRLTGEQPD